MGWSNSSPRSSQQEKRPPGRAVACGIVKGMAYLRSFVLVGILGLCAVSLDTTAPRGANLAAAYYSSAGGGGGGAYAIPALGNAMQGGSILQSMWGPNPTYMMLPGGTQIRTSTQKPAATPMQPVSTIIKTTEASPSLQIDSARDVAPVAIETQPSGIANQLLQLLSVPERETTTVSPFFTDPAHTLSRLLEIAYFGGTSDPQVVTPKWVPPPSPSITEAGVKQEPVSQNTPPTIQMTPTLSGNTTVNVQPGSTRAETTFADGDASMDEHEYIREVIGRMQQNRFVTNADYQVALVLAKDRVAESRALLDTRSSFQKFMDWLGIGSSLMIAYQQAEADLADLTYAAGLAGLGTQ